MLTETNGITVGFSHNEDDKNIRYGTQMRQTNVFSYQWAKKQSQTWSRELQRENRATDSPTEKLSHVSTVYKPLKATVYSFPSYTVGFPLMFSLESLDEIEKLHRKVILYYFTILW